MDYIIKGETLTAIADSIRSQLSSEDLLSPEEMAEAVGKINSDTLFITPYCEGTPMEIKSNATLIRQYCFYRWFQGVTKMEFPMAKEVGVAAFYGCSVAKTAIFPAVVTLGSQAFRGCSQIKKFDFDCIEEFEDSVFYQCTNLDTLIIRTDKVANNLGANTIRSTKIDGGTGYIYVPSALIEEYKAATNWAAYADQFRAIEDYPEITGGDTSE